MAESDRLRIAVFIDFDNIEIGVKNTLGASFDAGLVLEALKERGEVVSKTAYSDWQRAGGYSRALTQHAIRMVQRNLTPGGDKNGADINLALDALEMAFTHPHINAFVIVGGDSDFISLVEKLKQYDKKVFIVGGRQFTSGILQRNCHEFIAYENLAGASVSSSVAASGRPQAGRGVRVERAPVDQAIPLVTRALKVLSEREVSPQLGLLKSTLIQLDSTFSERNYGAGSFRDFVQKLERTGVVKLHQGKGGWLVELLDANAPIPERTVAHGDEAEAAPGAAASADAADARQASAPERASAAPEVIGNAAEGLRVFRDLLATAEIRRWPMYLRNVKQVLRQTNAAFDERAYGFANLTDLLRAAHKDGVVRVDRDRQGVIRVFQGSAPQPSPVAAAEIIVPDDMTSPHVQDDTNVDDGEDASVASAASEMGVPLMAVGAPDEDPDDNFGNVEHGTPVKRKRPRSRPAAPRGGRAPRGRRPSKERA